MEDLRRPPEIARLADAHPASSEGWRGAGRLVVGQGGVGLARSPQRFLASGDVVVSRIEGIGEIRQECRVTD
jgi:hypothetical protein